MCIDQINSNMRHRSLRKVMLRTCIDSETSTAGKDQHPPYTRAAKKRPCDNGGVFGKTGHGLLLATAPGRSANATTYLGHHTASTTVTTTSEDFRHAFRDDFPEDIPGLPRHRPAGLIEDYSPR